MGDGCVAKAVRPGHALPLEAIFQGADTLSLQAFLARRVITPEGIRLAAILVEGERIQAVVSPDQVPDGSYKIHDFGEAVLLPGLVDSRCPDDVFSTALITVREE